MQSDTHTPRLLVRLLIALAVALIAGTAFVLGASATLDATWDSRGAVILALAAFWIPQTLLFAVRSRRH